MYRSRIHERKFVEVSGHSVYNVYITKQFQTSYAQEGGVVKSVSRGNCESKDFCLNTSTNSASVQRQKLVDKGAEKGQI